MKEVNQIVSQENIDRLHHLLQEQIALISVKEEEERIREEIANGNQFK